MRKILIPLFLIGLSVVPVLAAARVEYSVRTSQGVSASFDEFEDLILQAFNHYRAKKYDEGLADCAKAMKLRPDDNRPYAVAGLIYMAQWKMKSASDSLAKAISLSPRNARLHVLRSKADRFRNAKDEAVASARKAIELDPNYAEAYVALADALSIGAKDHSEIIQNYRTAIRLEPDDLESYKQLGMFLEVSKDTKGAEDVYRDAMKRDPKKMASRFELGRLLVDEGRLDEARELWNGRTSDEDNTFPNFIDVLTRAEKKKEADIALAKNPNDPKALLQKGLAVMEGDSWVVDGRQEKAIAYFRKALAIDPKLVDAQYAICKAYVEWADTYKSKNPELDAEIVTLRKMDPKLADKIVEYRKNYSGGLKAGPGTIDQ